MQDVLLAVALLVILGLAVFSIIKAKKSGKKCIGCPDSDGCSGCCGCSSHDKE